MQLESSDYLELIQRLRPSASADADPPADLWLRIHGAHTARSRRQRRRRLGAAACIIVASIAATSFVPRRHEAPQAAVADIDWQARAQALELQLHAIDANTPNAERNSFAQEAEADLISVDRNLQTAYDNAASKNALVPLWKQRSELLSALVTARRQGLTMSHI